MMPTPRLAALNVWLFLCAFGVTACHSTAQPATTAPLSATAPSTAALAAGPVAGRPWATKSCKFGVLTADVLACVQGVAITRGDFDAVRADYPAQVSNRAVVQALIDAELLAAAAQEKGLWQVSILAQSQRKAIAGRLLSQKLERELTPDKIVDADIEFAWKNQDVHRRYDRVATYYVTDVQILCCQGDFHQCLKREEVRTCIDNSAKAAAEIYAMFEADPPQNGLEMAAKMASTTKWPLVGTQALTFYYDKTKPYEEQKGYNLMVREFTEAVIALQPGQIHAPVRSAFGWHISRLDKFEPAVHLTPKDPVVRREIAEHVLDAVRKRDAETYVARLMHEANVQFMFEALR